MRVLFAPEAEQDLNSAVDFLTGRSPAAAARLVAGVRSLVQRLADGDFEGPEQQLRFGETVKSWPLSPACTTSARMKPCELSASITRRYGQSRDSRNGDAIGVSATFRPNDAQNAAPAGVTFW